MSENVIIDKTFIFMVDFVLFLATYFAVSFNRSWSNDLFANCPEWIRNAIFDHIEFLLQNIAITVDRHNRIHSKKSSMRKFSVFEFLSADIHGKLEYSCLIN